MAKFLVLIGFTFGFHNLAIANDDVCKWQSPDQSSSMSTKGYTFGGSSFSSLNECVTALTSTLLFYDFGSVEGTITFKDLKVHITNCYVKALHYPPTEAPNGFYELMWKASEGKSSAKEVEQFKSYLDENLNVACSLN